MGQPNDDNLAVQQDCIAYIALMHVVEQVFGMIAQTFSSKHGKSNDWPYNSSCFFHALPVSHALETTHCDEADCRSVEAWHAAHDSPCV